MIQCFRVECSGREGKSAAYGVNPLFAREELADAALADKDRVQIRASLRGSNSGPYDERRTQGRTQDRVAVQDESAMHGSRR
ncbi:MAG: hypothetical protein BVN29_16525 [Nitrospira sp. ST-bin5]|nr:MAG: hypothetical protein BVN29_16525 [Nitrospira sp. ST-bin5]